MDDIKTALDGILVNDLDSMRQNFANALSSKASEKLEELKAEVAATFFEER